MLTIERLRLTLPPGFEHRADFVARLVAHELAALPLTRSCVLDRLTVPPLKIDPAGTDRDVAMEAARAIHTELTREGE